MIPYCENDGQFHAEKCWRLCSSVCQFM